MVLQWEYGFSLPFYLKEANDDGNRDVAGVSAFTVSGYFCQSSVGGKVQLLSRCVAAAAVLMK